MQRLAPGIIPPMGVLFDSAFGDSLEDLLALSLLYSLDKRGECRVAGLTTTKHCLDSARLLEVMQKLYGGRPTAIGMSTTGPQQPSGPLLQAALAGQTFSIKREVDTAEPHNLLRNLLESYHDGNAVIISTGPPANLNDLLRLPKALPVVKAKVKTLYLAGPHSSQPTDWPGPVQWIRDADAAALTYQPQPADFEWNPLHPVKLALEAQPAASWSRAGLFAALRAVRREKADPAGTGIKELMATPPSRMRP